MEIIEKYCGSEISNPIKDIIEKLQCEADYVSQKIGTDLDSYESDLESYGCVLHDVYDMLDKLEDEVNDSKRLDRASIIKQLRNMQIQISNVY